MNGEMHGRKRGADVFETWAWLLGRLDRSGPVRDGMDSPCWVWTGPRERKGYGRLDVQKKPILTHRLAWWATHGEPPAPDMKVLHACDFPPCCNPAHLRLGTYADNNADRHVKGRDAVGAAIRARHPLNKLSPEAVVAIRLESANGVSAEELAARFGVTTGTIRRAASGRSWAYVANPPAA